MSDSKKFNPTVAAQLTDDDVRSVSPALEHYTTESVLGGLWKRPELSPRDRSLVSVAAAIARIQTMEMPVHIALALDDDVKPEEFLEIITHLAFYAGLGKCHGRRRRCKRDLPAERFGNISASACQGQASVSQ